MSVLGLDKLAAQQRAEKQAALEAVGGGKGGGTNRSTAPRGGALSFADQESGEDRGVSGVEGVRTGGRQAAGAEGGGGGGGNGRGGTEPGDGEGTGGKKEPRYVCVLVWFGLVWFICPTQVAKDGGGGYSLVACLSQLTIDHSSLSRRSTVPSPNRDTSNVRALLTLFPYFT